jgi:TonB family protein
VKEGDPVGPGEGVVEPKLIGSLVFPQLPPQAKSIQAQRGAGGVIGTPNILALIDEHGVVTATRVLKPSSYKFVDEAAVTALKHAKFAPATKNGIKVKMWKMFAIGVKP